MSVSFNGATGAKMLDGKHIIPQKALTVSVGDHPLRVQTDAQGTHPGYTMRQHTFTWPLAANRPSICFFEMPDHDGRDVWMNGGGGNGSSQGVCTILHPKNMNPSTLRTVRCHIFALDTVTRSNASNGMRLWTDGGKLIYDSGNQHLSVHSTVGGITFDWGDGPGGGRADYPAGNSRAFPTGYLAWPQPALVLPVQQMFKQYGYNQREYEYTAETFYAIHGATLDTRVMRTSFGFTSESARPEFANYFIPPSQDLQTIVIPGSLYT